MQRGTIIGYTIGRPKSDMLPEHVSNDCPPGSDCAKAAVERVRLRLLGQDRRFSLPGSKARFVGKTGCDGTNQ